MAWGFTSVGWEHLSSMYEALDLKPSTAYCVLWLRLEAGGLMKYQLQLCSSQWLMKPNLVRTPTSEVFYWYCGGLCIVTLKWQTSLDSQRTGWGLFIDGLPQKRGELGNQSDRWGFCPVLTWNSVLPKDRCFITGQPAVKLVRMVDLGTWQLCLTLGIHICALSDIFWTQHGSSCQ